MGRQESGALVGWACLGMGGWALWGCLGRGLWFLMVLEGGEMGQETGETAEKSTTYESTESRLFSKPLV